MKNQEQLDQKPKITSDGQKVQEIAPQLKRKLIKSSSQIRESKRINSNKAPPKKVSIRESYKGNSLMVHWFTVAAILTIWPVKNLIRA